MTESSPNANVPPRQSEPATPGSPALAEVEAASLDSVVDDRPPNLDEPVEWATEELIRGKSFDMLTADLLANGWSPELAERIVEQARELTRGNRGVHTREDVLADAERRYRRSLRRIRLMLIAALALVLITLLFFFQSK